MGNKLKILVINPGSTSTAIALFENDKLLDKEIISHNLEELSKYKKIITMCKNCVHCVQNLFYSSQEICQAPPYLLLKSSNFCMTSAFPGFSCKTFSNS